MGNPLNLAKDDKCQILDLLEQVVNIDSPSPYVEGVNRVGKVFGSFLEELGFTTNYLSGEKYGNQVYGEYGDGQPSILLMGHMDTVFPQGTTNKRPFEIHRGEKRAYGPGILDMKSGIVIMLHSLKLFLQSRNEIDGKISVLLNSDEERGSPESRKHLKDILEGIKWSFIFEQGTPKGELVTKRKGEGIYTLTARGISSHTGSEPEVGANAIDELMRHLLKIEKLDDPEQGTTINVGTIEGGEEPSVVPDYAEAQVDFRVKSRSEQRRIERKMPELVEKTYVPETTTELDGNFHRPPMEPVEGTEKIMEKTKQTIDKLDQQVQFAEYYRGEASDGNCIVDMGVPCIDGLGAVGEGAHGENEYIELDSLYSRTRLFANLLEEIL
ncbi:MAG: M20 family metallopeptidase [Candidatus Acetothermia bacterium]